MTELLTARQMRAVEQAAMASGAVTGLELMERAGQGVLDTILAYWPDLADRPARAIVFCGPGNNGGDGFVIARLMQARGWAVSVCFEGALDRLPPDARTNCDRWVALSGLELSRTIDLASAMAADLIVDALFGTGLSRAVILPPTLAALFRASTETMSASGPRIVAVDIISGLDADSGRCLVAPYHADPASPKEPAPIHADLTVTFHRPKIGHVLAEGPARSGTLAVVDIGIDAVAASETGPASEVARRVAPESGATPVDTAALLKKRSPFTGEGHKFTHGHALVVTGGAGRTGAARLAARGALRIGAGLVTLAVPGAAQQEVACRITALMLTRADDAGALSAVLQDGRINALCLGPGLGASRARALVPAALAAARATVLDADALTAFADAPAALFGMVHDTCVLTPHGGEFARLFPDIAKRVREDPMRGPAFSKVDATRAAAARAGCIVVFKGADTVIAAPDGRASVHAAAYDRAAPWLATAGSGDVLAGFITGLLARGLDPLSACEWATWLHVEAARAFGPGLIAEDLPETLPRVLAALQAGTDTAAATSSPSA